MPTQNYQARISEKAGNELINELIGAQKIKKSDWAVETRLGNTEACWQKLTLE